MDGGDNLYKFAPHALGWVDWLGLAGFFKLSTTPFSAPSNIKYIIYQQDIDWCLTDSRGKTNWQRALAGQAPQVIKNGRREALYLHHWHQQGKGPLLELSKSAHYPKGNLWKMLHPFGNKKHPTDPKNDKLFAKDQRAYWKARAAEAKKKGKCVC